MDEVQRLRVKQHGLKGSVTKLLTKVDDILSAELKTVNLNSTPESQRLLAATTATQLTAKRGQIEKLDDTIVAAIEEETELETEICDADTYLTTLEERITFLEEFVKQASQPPPAPRGTAEESQSRESRELISVAVDTLTHEPEVVKKPVHSVSTTQNRDEIARTDSTHYSHSRLPKLALPTFSGNPLDWQTFTISSSSDK